MTSNEDLMSYLKKMEEKREREKQEEAELRKQERAVDREEMVKLMNKCMEEKVSEIVAPIEKRTDKVEQVQSEMKDQMEILIEQMKVVNDKLDRGSGVVAESGQGQMNRVKPIITEIMSGGSGQPTSDTAGGPGTGDSRQGKEIREIISHSRRTVGLQQIDKYDLVRMRQDQFGGAVNEEEEKLFAVKEYLHLEIKISKATIEKMEIERIFTPAFAGEDHKWLYVTFKSEASVQKIYEKTRVMRKESRILNYIPREFHTRFEAIRDIGNSIRLSENCKTRIKMGFMDLQLHKKEGSQGRWELVPLPTDLPPVEVGISPKKADSGSPAPGRPDQVRGDKRERESSDTSPSNSISTKVARTKTPEVQSQEKQRQDDTGKVIGEESYCPASPAQPKANQVFNFNSPVFSKIRTGAIQKTPLNI